MEKKNPSTFDKLYAIDVTAKTETKGPRNLTYLAWASAWAIVKQHHSAASYVVYENVSLDGLVLNYFHDNSSCWVKVGTKLTPDGTEHIMTLPVMDYHYKSISREKVTSHDVNTAIQRCLVKSLAMHGLGLYIYEKDELPEKTPAAAPKPAVVKKAPVKKAILPLKVGDNNWPKVVMYVRSNKTKLTLPEVCKQLSVKYKITAPIKKEFSKIIGS